MNYRLIFLLTLVSALQSGAQNNPGQSTPQLPALNLRVLEGVEVKFPDHSVFYRRVAPPVAPAVRLPVAAPVAKPLSLAESAVTEARAQKKSAVLMLSATVYDRRVTELRWFADGREYRAWSNIDFNLLAGLGEIETEDCVYSLIMGLGNETRESVVEKAMPDPSAFPVGRSTYLLTGNAPADESLAALDALHRYYDANRRRLIAVYEKRQAANAAREQWLKEHPPMPENTVINFWPIKSRIYPTGQ